MMSKIPLGAFVRRSEEEQAGRGKLTNPSSSLCFRDLAEGCANRTHRRPTGLPPVLKFAQAYGSELQRVVTNTANRLDTPVLQTLPCTRC